jgi:hypothetical protein
MENILKFIGRGKFVKEFQDYVDCIKFVEPYFICPCFGMLFWYLYDPNTGWRMRPGYNEIVYFPGRSFLDEINRDGWRDKLYPIEKPKGSIRLGMLGCSFTYGVGVKMEESYPKVLERMFHDQGRSNIEVMNFGTNGWGLDQMLIGYKSYIRKYKPDLLVVLYTSDTILRTAYPEMWSTLKPYFFLNNGRLMLGNLPVPERRYQNIERFFLRNSYLCLFIKDNLLKIAENWKYKRFYDYTKTLAGDENLFDLNVAIMKLFKEVTDQDGVRLLVFVYDKSAPSLSKVCRLAGVEVLDIQDMLPGIDMRSSWQEDSPLHFPPPIMHWNILGNKYVAQGLYKYLSAKTDL